MSPVNRGKGGIFVRPYNNISRRARAKKKAVGKVFDFFENFENYRSFVRLGIVHTRVACVII